MEWHGMAWHACEAAEVNADFACRSVRSSFELLLPRFRSPASLNPGGIASSESWQKKGGNLLCPSVSICVLFPEPADPNYRELS